MFLSKISYDRRRWDVMHDLEERDRLHKKVLKLFPDYPGGGRRNARELMGVLFRVEPRYMVLQSKLAPDPARLSRGYTIERSQDVSANFAAIRQDATYRFRLDANTSVKVEVPEEEDWVPTVVTRRKTRRVGCGSFPAREQWIQRIAKYCGFEPLEFTMNSLSAVRINKKGILEATRFEGRIRVVRLESFLQMMHRGIGKGKPYGLGLMSIRNG